MKILTKSNLQYNQDAIGVMTDFVNVFGSNPDEETLEKFIGLVGMLCPLPNYYQLHAEFCPGSCENNPEFQAAASKVGAFIRKTISYQHRKNNLEM